MSATIDFMVTEDHLKLVRRLRFLTDLGDEDYGGLDVISVDSKRPYGNSDQLLDIAEILGYNDITSEDELSAGDLEKFRKLHSELEVVLTILTRNLTIKPGLYRSRIYYDDWAPVEEFSEEA